MRLPIFTLFHSTLAILSALPALVSSIHPHAIVQRRNNHNRSPLESSEVLSSRQYRVTRDLLDVCIDANLDLANATQLLGLQALLGPLDVATGIQLCLCLKDLDVYLDTNDHIQALISLLGKDPVRVLIAALINTSPDAQECSFPPHAHHTCNTGDACHYDCDSPYVKQDGVCVCAPPNFLCNGVCGYFPQGCGSAVPNLWKKRTNAIHTITQARASCRSHETVCGIAGREGAQAFECIDVDASKDSCGGCMTPHPFFDDGEIRQSVGKDCTVILNAKSVSCSERRCVVHSCDDGWLPNPSNDECVLADHLSWFSKMRRIRRSSTLGTKSTSNLPPSQNSMNNAHLSLAFSDEKAITSDSDLSNQVEAFITQILELEDTLYSTPSLSSNTSPVDPSLLDDMSQVIRLLLQSSSVASLIRSLERLYVSECVIRDALNECNCIQNMRLDDVESDLLLAIEATLALLDWCNGTFASSSGSNITLNHHTTITSLQSIPCTSAVTMTGPHTTSLDAVNSPYVPRPLSATFYTSPVSSLPSSTDRPDIPIVLDLDHLLGSLGLGQIKGIATVNGLLGNDANNDIDNILDGLDIGPHDVRRRNGAESVDSEDAPLIVGLDRVLDGLGLGDVKAVVDIDGLLSHELDHSLDTILDGLNIGPHDVSMRGMRSENLGNEGDVPIVVGLNHLLDSVGLEHVEAVATVDGLLGNSLDGTTNNLLDELRIGPHGVRKRASLLDSISALLHSLGLGSNPPVFRADSTQGNDGASVDKPSGSPSSAQLEGVVGDLVNELLLLNFSKRHLPASGESSMGLPANVNERLVDDIIAAVVCLLSSRTYPDFVKNVDALESVCKDTVQILDGCSCVENDIQEVYGYLAQTLKLAVTLKALCHSQDGESSSTSLTPADSTIASGDNGPLVVGLTKLLKGLGLNITANAAINGLLNDRLDHGLNTILDDFDIGPNGQRKRVVALARSLAVM